MTGYQHEIRLGAYRPPEAARIARRLWAEGVYVRELLERAERWEGDGARAWAECERLELALPLALLRGASVDALAGVARAWWHSAVHRLGGLEALAWSGDDRYLALRCVDGAAEPDVDLERLIGVRAAALGRVRGPGRHRYRLLTAAAHVAGIGIQRVRQPLSVYADAMLVGEHLAGAVHDAADAADLFSGPVDVDAFVRSALELAREQLLLEVAAE